MKRTLTLLLLLTALFGCTKQHVVEADTTYDTQWTPQINIVGNNYHRVELLLDMPPRKTLYRNIADFKIQYRRSGAVLFSVLATLPFDRWSAPQWHVLYGTEHSLTEDSNYSFRMVVSYTDSTQRVSRKDSDYSGAYYQTHPSSSSFRLAKRIRICQWVFLHTR
jgi:hypothetical protein